ncbi:MAG: Fe-S cluster domain-containing protein [Rikenellaceae bacterium]|nr:Fe-S cluster domain-containing protein [Rikenellaceae bacterium]
MEILLYTVLTLCLLGAVAAMVLYLVARKFYVYEDPRIDQVENLLPLANCGGCGYPGCRGLADALVKNDDITSLYCPVGGTDTMNRVAAFLGKSAPEKEPQIAEVRCGGSCGKRPRISIYDGAYSCAVEHSLYSGETGCNYGCLGKGDCVVVCNFDAIAVNPETGIPEVDPAKCTACGACVRACPRAIMELRKKGVKDRRVWVNCINRDKGAVSRKLCTVSCIACGKCVKTCPFEAITLQDNLAYIDPYKCRLCRKCVPECPTSAISEINFPPKKETPAGGGKGEGNAAVRVKDPTSPSATSVSDGIPAGSVGESDGNRPPQQA